MNLRAAQVDLGGPPKVRLQILALEAVAILAVSYLLVGFFS